MGERRGPQNWERRCGPRCRRSTGPAGQRRAPRAADGELRLLPQCERGGARAIPHRPRPDTSGGPRQARREAGRAPGRAPQGPGRPPHRPPPPHLGAARGEAGERAMAGGRHAAKVTANKSPPSPPPPRLTGRRAGPAASKRARPRRGGAGGEGQSRAAGPLPSASRPLNGHPPPAPHTHSPRRGLPPISPIAHLGKNCGCAGPGHVPPRACSVSLGVSRGGRRTGRGGGGGGGDRAGRGRDGRGSRARVPLPACQRACAAPGGGRGRQGRGGAEPPPPGALRQSPPSWRGDVSRSARFAPGGCAVKGRY